MKRCYTQKRRLFPMAVIQKKPFQPWNPLAKLSKTYKRLYKSKGRFFSLEYGRSLSKRILWQVAIPLSLQNPQPWSLFKTMLVGKLWVFNNPSLVPGVVWPVKSKKRLVTQLRALKALGHLVGKKHQRFLFKMVQKCHHLANPTLPFLWSMVVGLDALKTSVLLKTAWVSTLPISFKQFSSGEIQMNGKKHQNRLGKNLHFSYLADWFQSMHLFALKPRANLFGNLFSTGGARKVSSQADLGVYYSMYRNKPFVWLKDFYKKGLVPSSGAGTFLSKVKFFPKKKAWFPREKAHSFQKPSYFFQRSMLLLFFKKLGHRQVVRHQILILTCVGSNPSAPEIYFF